MSRTSFVKPVAALALGGLVLALAVEAASANDGAGRVARPAAADRSIQRPARPARRDRREQQPHRPLTRETQMTRTEDGFTRSTTITDAQGQTATRNVNVVNDKDAGTRVVDVNRTGFDGRTSGVRHETQRTPDGYTRDSTWNLPNGQTRTRSVDVSCDEQARKCVKEVDVNGGAGKD